MVFAQLTDPFATAVVVDERDFVLMATFLGGTHKQRGLTYFRVVLG